ncbi:hypothetical protein D3C71_314360 [compost metagenome]
MAWHLNGEPAPRDPNSGWLLLGDTQFPPDWPHADLEARGLTRVEPALVELTTAQCLDALADMRWLRTQSFTFDEVLTQADPAIAVVNATLAMRSRRGVPASAVQAWKLGQGDFRQWDEHQIEAFGFAIADHIQACFDREEELSAQIIAAEAPAAIDITTGWPS